MDVWLFIIGFVIGVVCVAVAMEYGLKKTSKTEPSSRTTQKWTMAEIKNPRIIAEYLGDIDIPKKSRMVVNQYSDENLLKGLNVRKHSKIKGNFILGDDRALILSGPIKENEIGVWTVEKEILNKLNGYFEEAWSKGSKLEFSEKK
jgi:hypothetical protein